MDTIFTVGIINYRCRKLKKQKVIMIVRRHGDKNYIMALLFFIFRQVLQTRRNARFGSYELEK